MKQFPLFCQNCFLLVLTSTMALLGMNSIHFRNLLLRTFHFCFDWHLFHSEIMSVRAMLLRNAYPAWLLDKVIKLAVDKLVNPSVLYGPRKERVYWLAISL